MLFDEFQLFTNCNMMDQWKLTFNSLLFNVQKRKRGFAYSLRDKVSKTCDDFSYIASSEKMEDLIIKGISDTDYSGFCKLKVFQSQTDLFIKDCVERYKDDTQYTLQKIQGFIDSQGGIQNFDFIPQDLVQVLVNNSN